MKVAVAGSTGFLGYNLVAALVEKGDCEINVLIRDKTKAHRLDPFSLNITYGDLSDESAVEKWLEGVSVLFYCAAYVDLRKNQYQKLYKANVELLKPILKLCVKNKIRLIYISSIEAIGDPIDTKILSEDLGINPDRAMIEYGRTKAYAALLILKAKKEENLEATILCPSGIVGPYDWSPSILGKAIILLNQLPIHFVYKQGGFEFVHVKDIVKAMLVASINPPPHSVYIISGAYYSHLELTQIIQKHLGKTKKIISLPRWMMYAFSIIHVVLFTLLKKQPIFSPGFIRILHSRLHCSTDLAKKDLNFTAHSVDQGIQEQIQFFKQQKWIK